MTGISYHSTVCKNAADDETFSYRIQTSPRKLSAKMLQMMKHFRIEFKRAQENASPDGNPQHSRSDASQKSAISPLCDYILNDIWNRGVLDTAFTVPQK